MSTTSTSFVPKIRQRLLMLSWVFLVFALFSKSSFGDKWVTVLQIGGHISKRVFPNFFPSSSLNSGCLETFVNCITKCVTAKLYPLEVLSNFTENLIHLSINLRPHHRSSFFWTKMSWNRCKMCHKLHNDKNLVPLRFTWQNEPIYIIGLICVTILANFWAKIAYYETMDIVTSPLYCAK